MKGGRGGSAGSIVIGLGLSSARLAIRRGWWHGADWCASGRRVRTVPRGVTAPHVMLDDDPAAPRISVLRYSREGEDTTLLGRTRYTCGDCDVEVVLGNCYVQVHCIIHYIIRVGDLSESWRGGHVIEPPK